MPGDLLNWDPTLDCGIDPMNLTGAISVFGFNALRRAVCVEMKSGLKFQGEEAD